MDDAAEVRCPYCGERIWMEADMRDGMSQRFIVDCEVCCSPVEYTVRFDEEGGLSLEAKRGDE